MPKEKSINPAQAQRKAEKAKAIKKSKAEAAARRNEKLSRRNPDRLQKQLDELKAIESGGGRLTNHEKNLRDGLEKELRAVLKARDSIGNSAQTCGTGLKKNFEGNFHNERNEKTGCIALGKRRRELSESSDDSDVPEDVKHIPMPRDTPPPIPKDVLDKWYQKRREKKGIFNDKKDSNTNLIPLGDNARNLGRANGNTEESMETEPKLQSQTVYEAKPVIRDLRKEAVAFVPTVVQTKIEKSKGVVEPEEAEELEKEGYLPIVKPQVE
ncbi:Protein saf1 [Golovinomyces cichoracearum]|uniref:Protein saf1 n=1 Tax=Golovinomyces cichoracearum TaxID=62708 RepID=A0A420I961_9PEZI|nr:Protein saf1 [Golovinomyces cichoracearum]